MYWKYCIPHFWNCQCVKMTSRSAKINDIQNGIGYHNKFADKNACLLWKDNRQNIYGKQISLSKRQQVQGHRWAFGQSGTNALKSTPLFTIRQKCNILKLIDRSHSVTTMFRRGKMLGGRSDPKGGKIWKANFSWEHFLRRRLCCWQQEVRLHSRWHSCSTVLS